MDKTNNRSITFKEVNIAYYTKGDVNKSAICFLHPAFGDSNMFCKQVDYFEEDYFLIFIDMIGHGNSQPDKSLVNMGDMPTIINMILKTEKIEKAHIVGVSLGSLVAQSFAYYYPSKTLSVTVVGGYSIHKENKEIKKAQGKEIIKWTFLILFSMKYFRKKISEISSYSDLCKKTMEKGAERFTRKSFAAMGGQNKLFIDKNEIVHYPLLLIVGEFDLELAKNSAKILNKIEPNSTLKIIEDAGHCANIDNPKKFNRLLNDFLKITEN